MFNIVKTVEMQNPSKNFTKQISNSIFWCPNLEKMY